MGDSGSSLRSAAEGQDVEADELQSGSACFFVSCEATFVSCDTTTGEYAAVRPSAINVMRRRCVGRCVLPVIFSPIKIFGRPRDRCHKMGRADGIRPKNMTD